MIMTGVPMDNQNKIIKLGYNKQEGYSAKEIETYGLMHQPLYKLF